ncbi:AAA family ATPase [Rhodococcus hoagii]|nr:AAA family ATPase [Prescottella equi]
MNIEISKTEDHGQESKRSLGWSDRRITSDLSRPIPRSESKEHRVPICAFHSFKGGVGRTLHCVSLAHQLARSTGSKVLLVDADLEAPGISWMAREEGVRADFSFEAFLALVQGSTDGMPTDAVNIGQRFLANQEIDDVFILPARFDTTLARPPRIHPLDLQLGNSSPYILTDALAELAHSVGASCVVVDLRAGASELNAPILLDHRVRRVFVSTVNHQSVQGTLSLINEIARRAPSLRSTDPKPFTLITQFNPTDHSDLLQSVVGDFSEAINALDQVDASASLTDEDDVTSLRLGSAPLQSAFNPLLLAMSASWSDVVSRVESAHLARALSPLLDEINRAITSDDVPAQSPQESDETSPVIASRTLLGDYASRFKFAETASATDLLRTESLENLVRSNKTDAPIEVVVGAKGSGKTFTFRAMCEARRWDEFARIVKVGDVDFDALLVPVFKSQNFADDGNDSLKSIRDEAATQLGGSPSRVFLTDIITEALQLDLSDREWRQVWLQCFAEAAGCETTFESAEAAVLALAQSHRAVFVLDGLEDIFQALAEDKRQQQALRVLLTNCADWLRSVPGRPLGLIVFVRRDLVQIAIPQNTAQFLSRYQNFELRWDRIEALRLAAWVSHNSGALEMQSANHVQTATQAELSSHLLALWGERLGTRKSREARSEEWFIAALSDFNLQIQARDIVSFLSVAATGSTDESHSSSTRWTDRILTPTAMRKALPQCSREKIDSISSENPPLGKILEELRNMDEELKRVPFSATTLGLSSGDIGILERSGVIFRESNDYWMPEIYRQGLDFKAGRRPRVLTMAKLVRRRNDSS